MFERVVTTEPKSAPGNGLSVAVWVQELGPVGAASGLNAVSVRLVLMIRVLKPMLSQPYGQIDPDILTAVDTLMAAYAGSFQLGGGIVRNIDLLGQHGVPMAARAGYVTIDKAMFRIMDITLPMIVNDLWNETP
jgi:hypothetical protein